MSFVAVSDAGGGSGGDRGAPAPLDRSVAAEQRRRAVRQPTYAFPDRTRRIARNRSSDGRIRAICSVRTRASRGPFTRRQPGAIARRAGRSCACRGRSRVRSARPVIAAWTSHHDHASSPRAPFRFLLVAARAVRRRPRPESRPRCPARFPAAAGPLAGWSPGPCSSHAFAKE